MGTWFTSTFQDAVETKDGGAVVGEEEACEGAWWEGMLVCVF